MERRSRQSDLKKGFVIPEECVVCDDVVVGTRRLELRTSSLSEKRSNQLSYAPT